MSSQKMPVLFIGHGNPMNAIANNPYTQTLHKLGKDLPRPRAILCISAHWLTGNLQITAMNQPRTIHDFYGFPQELFAVQYPAPGAPDIAQDIFDLLKTDYPVTLDETWGLDHGTWSVLKHIYPAADIPVLQLSIAIRQSPQFQFDIGKKLAPLKDQGILIVGSGDIVHNLRVINFSSTAPAFPWAESFNQWTQDKLDEKNFSAIVNASLLREDGKLSIPTPDHWYPFLTSLGAADENQRPLVIYDGIENSSISMKSLLFS